MSFEKIHVIKCMYCLIENIDQIDKWEYVIELLCCINQMKIMI